MGIHLKERGQTYHLIMSKWWTAHHEVGGGQGHGPSVPGEGVSGGAAKAGPGLRKVNP